MRVNVRAAQMAACKLELAVQSCHKRANLAVPGVHRKGGRVSGRAVLMMPIYVSTVQSKLQPLLTNVYQLSGARA